MRRAGGRFVAENINSTVRSRLRRFEYSTTQAYMLELGAGEIHFFRHQGQIVSEATDAVVTNGTFDSDFSGWTDDSTGAFGAIEYEASNQRLALYVLVTSDKAIATQSIATTALNVEHVLRFRIAGVPGEPVMVGVGTAVGNFSYFEETAKYAGYHCIAFTPTASPFVIQFSYNTISGGGRMAIDDVSILNAAPVSIGNPYSEEDLLHTSVKPGVEGPQSADVLYLFHGDHPTHKLERYGHTMWSLTEVAWQDGPWLEQNEEETTLTPATTSASQTHHIRVEADAVDGINGGRGFLSTDVGRLLRLSNPASGIDWSWGIIAEVQTPLVIFVHFRRIPLTTNATAAWRLGAWSATTGYPKNGAFYEQRTFACNTDTQPQTLWAANTGDFENMAPDSANDTGVWDGTVEDDDALNYTISADEVNAIFSMSPGEDSLALITAGGEWVPISQGAVLTPTDMVIRKQTSHKAAPVQPIRIGSVVLFVQRAKRKIREFGFSFEIDGYRAPDMTRLAQHITAAEDRGGIVEMAYAEEPDSLVWAVRSDGQLLSMTYRREEDVVGWSRHLFGGNFDGGDAVVESVAVIPGADGDGQVQNSEDRDEVWVIVKRTINGQTVRYIEVLERDYEHGGPQEDAYYADSLITYDGTAETVITNLDHLEGETVKILADGATVTDQVVSGGQITLDEAAEVVQIGLGYTHKLNTLKIEGGTQAGTAVGKVKRISGVTLVLLDSATVSIGPDADTLEEKDFRTVEDDVDAAVPLFTGEQFLEFDGDWETDARIYIESDDPFPFNLLAIAPEVAVNEVK